MTANFPPVVSAIITFHREGLLAHKSLLALGRCRRIAAAAGIPVEVVATLDRADDETKRVVQQHRGDGQPDRVLELSLGDLGSARNAAVEAALGRWVLICDGDDYLSASFIVQCLRMSKLSRFRSILHPELVLTFGAEQTIWRQTGSDHPGFDPACMLVCNPWNSCCFSVRETFLEHPYTLARPGETGFGFEDWHWNCETLATGHVHQTVPQTVHYVRKKVRNSLNQAHASHRSIIAPSQLFALQ